VQDATVLFLDIENFSTLVRNYALARVNRAIEAYFSAFFDVILLLGGDVNETAGDGMMVLFLDEDPSKNASNAVQAAQDIQKECKRLSRSGPGDLFPISIKIGISSGEVYLGSTKMTGSAGNRWTFTASGPVTVLAARLSDYAKGGQILISENTARRVALSFTINPLGRINLKNIDDSGEIYQVS
jgi:class 3 adenylate cyclase